MKIPTWKEFLALEGRTAPELFEHGMRVIGSPYADEIRKVMDELSIVAMFCVQGVPQIAILEQAQYDTNEVLKVHAALWNQGLASVLIVSSNDTVRVFSLAKTPGTGDVEEFERRCLIEAIDASSKVLSLSDYVYGAESGRLWHEKSEYFDPKQRIDSILLENLTVAHELLSDHGLTAEEAQAILIQTMFIAYLEDHGITPPEFFENITQGKYKSLSSILDTGDGELLGQLFKQLQRDFNGDLFVAPCSFDNPDHPPRLSAQTMNILRRFREGREEMCEMSGQLRFWGYDFRFIPVELISAVYDRFLGHDEGARHAAGAYYTPMFLVDTVISSVWETIDDQTKSKGTFFDPACGSGIFLVRSFQRMCEHWRQNAKTDTIRWDSLLKMLSRVGGRDLNGGAVRVAVFSLYIALLEEVSPPDIRKLASKGRLLPPLWNETLIQRDFFEEDAEEFQADVIVGNPPWTSRRNTNSSGAAWCNNRKLPMPSREEAWAFVWKARDHLKASGTVAFLLPAMGFLHNHAANSIRARIRLFESAKVTKVINFSDLRRQLFDSAMHATALIMFKNEPVEAENSDYKFEYWTPKADLNLRIKRFIALSAADKSLLRLSDVQQKPLIFKQRLWMRSPEAKLFNYLERLPKLSNFVMQYGVLKKRRMNTNEGWVIGQGFKSFNTQSTSRSSLKNYESEYVEKLPYLPIEAFTPVSINSSDLVPWHTKNVHRLGFERSYVGPRILVSRGVSTSSMRLQASYVDTPLTFRSIMQAIVPPEREGDHAKFVAAVLNSRLAIWYAFHGTSSFGSSRPEVQQAELLRLPMPEPENLASEKQAREAREELVNTVDRHREEQTKALKSPDFEEEILREIDKLTYAYFGLSDDEITLIEDAVQYIFPAAQPNVGSFPELWKTSRLQERTAYANQLTHSLSHWFDHNRQLSVDLVGSNQDFGILRLKLHSKQEDGEARYSESSDTSFSDALGALSIALSRPIAQNFQTVPDMKIFVGNSLYLIKPMQRRFWLRSTALADADSVVSDLETMIATNPDRGLTS